MVKSREVIRPRQYDIPLSDYGGNNIHILGEVNCTAGGKRTEGLELSVFKINSHSIICKVRMHIAYTIVL